MATLEKYNKFLVALFGMALTLASARFGANEVFQVVSGVVTVLGVLHVRNVEVTDLVDDVEQAEQQVNPAPKAGETVAPNGPAA